MRARRRGRGADSSLAASLQARTVSDPLGSLIGVITPLVGVVILIVATLTCAAWFVGGIVRTAARPVSCSGRVQPGSWSLSGGCPDLAHLQPDLLSL